LAYLDLFPVSCTRFFVDAGLSDGRPEWWTAAWSRTGAMRAWMGRWATRAGAIHFQGPVAEGGLATGQREDRAKSVLGPRSITRS